MPDKEGTENRSFARMTRLSCPLRGEKCPERPEVWAVKPRVEGASPRFLVVCPVHRDGLLLVVSQVRKMSAFNAGEPEE